MVSLPKLNWFVFAGGCLYTLGAIQYFTRGGDLNYRLAAATFFWAMGEFAFSTILQ